MRSIKRQPQITVVTYAFLLEGLNVTKCKTIVLLKLFVGVSGRARIQKHVLEKECTIESLVSHSYNQLFVHLCEGLEIRDRACQVVVVVQTLSSSFLRKYTLTIELLVLHHDHVSLQSIVLGRSSSSLSLLLAKHDNEVLCDPYTFADLELDRIQPLVDRVIQSPVHIDAL